MVVGFLLVIEEEGGRVDQCPGEILRPGESPLGQLLGAQLEVVAQAVVGRVDAGRLL